MATTTNTTSLNPWLMREHPTFFPELLEALHEYLKNSGTSLGFEPHPSLKKSLSKADLANDFEDLKNRVSKHLQMDLNISSLTKNSITSYVKGLSKRAAERAVQLDLLEVFIRHLKQITGISAPPIPRLVTTKSDMPIVTASALLRGHIAAVINQQLSDEIQTPTMLTTQIEMSGRLALWLMFKLGVLDKELLKQVIQDPKAHFKQLKAFSYYEHGTKRVLLDTQSLLFLHQIWMIRHQDTTKITVIGAIKSYLKIVLPQLLKESVNITQLKEIAKVHLTLTSSPLLARQFSGKLQTTNLQDEPWIRLITGYPQPVLNDALEESFTLTERQRRTMLRHSHSGGLTQEKQKKSEKSILIKDKLKLIKTLTAPLFIKQNKDFTKAKTELKVWLESDQNFTDDPLCWLLLSWCIRLLEFGSSHKRVLRKDTVKDYLMSLATPVLTVLSNDDYDLSEAEDWIEALNKIVSLVKSPQRCAYVRYFAKFLLNNQIVPDLDLSELNIPGYQVKTDANLLTCQEAELLLNHLRKQKDEVAKVARILFCLGFFSGLRRNEAAKLKIKDIQINGGLSEVRVRRNKNRELKSPHSSRNVPMAPFWPEVEILFIKRFVDDARIEYRVDHDLFDDQDLVTNAFAYLTQCLKQLTQDQNFRFHHLRHSYANWIYYLLHQHQIRNRALQASFLQHEWLNEQISNQLKQRLGLTFDLSRKKLFMISYLLGHSAIETTCGSYLHLLDVFAFLITSDATRSSRKLLIHIHGYESVMTEQYPLKLTKISQEIAKQISLVDVAHATNIADLSLQSEKNDSMQIGTQLSSFSVNLVDLAEFIKRFEKDISLSNIAAKLRLTLNQVDMLVNAYQVVSNSSDQHVQKFFSKVKFNNLTNENFNQLQHWCEHLHVTNNLKNINAHEIQDIISILVPGKSYLPRSNERDKVRTLLKITKELSIHPQLIKFRLLLPIFRDELSENPKFEALLVNTIILQWQSFIADTLENEPHIDVVYKNELSKNRYIAKGEVGSGTLEHVKSLEVLYKTFRQTGLLEIYVTPSVKQLNDESGTTMTVRDRSFVCLLKLLLVWFQLNRN
ncbi:MAG: tyrosine-type recombinase/integrase [Alishewanella agri]|nr:tyrosine-type recombinase/integrase [Alishewanella agri]